MKTNFKRTGIVLALGVVLFSTGCKKKQVEQTVDSSTTVERELETVQSLSDKAREEQERKLKEEEARIAAEKDQREEQARLAKEADSLLRVSQLQRQQAIADSLAAVERERLAAVERDRLARIEAERRQRLEAEKRKAEAALRAEQACKCKAKTFKVQSSHSWAEFRMPAAKKGEVIKIKGGAYNKYVFPKCNRVWWSDLVFSCDPNACAWVKVQGNWDADALCHGSAGSSPYLKVGTK